MFIIGVGIRRIQRTAYTLAAQQSSPTMTLIAKTMWSGVLAAIRAVNMCCSRRLRYPTAEKTKNITTTPVRALFLSS